MPTMKFQQGNEFVKISDGTVMWYGDYGVEVNVNNHGWTMSYDIPEDFGIGLMKTGVIKLYYQFLQDVHDLGAWSKKEWIMKQVIKNGIENYDIGKSRYTPGYAVFDKFHALGFISDKQYRHLQKYHGLKTAE